MDTIYACATAPIKSSVAIFRISGPDSLKILSIITKDSPLPKARYASIRKIYNPKDNSLIDHALVIYFSNPASFTGEDVVELHIHGGRGVINQLLDVFANIDNIRLANPGEFSQRAFENGKFDLTQAEGLVDLINSETKLQASQAINQASGSLFKLYESWRSDLVKILSLIEAFLDFPEEDIPQNLTDEINKLKNKLEKDISKHLANANIGEKLVSGLDVVILGYPNVGKSSLINKLANRDIAIVSNIEGTTRDLLECHLDINGFPVILCDTAGIRETSEAIENIGIEKAKNRIDHADLKIIIFDANNSESANSQLLNLIDENTIICLNKIDINNNIPNYLNQYNFIKLSITENIGIDLLISKITDYVNNNFNIGEDPIITRSRYKESLQLCLDNLALFSLEKDLVLACEDLRSAANYLGKITGKIDVEEILDKLFSSFCIGK